MNYQMTKSKFIIILILGIMYHISIMCGLYLCTVYIVRLQNVKENLYYNQVLLHVKRSSVQIHRPHYVKNATFYRYVPGHRSHHQFICPNSGKNIKILIIVTSAVNHTNSRMAIRNTWAHYKASQNISVGFFIGSTTNNTLQKKINEENDMYRDIIQGVNIDSYMNLTLKSISVLEWTYKHCPKADFVLKSDDDAFINIPRLLDRINRFDKRDRFIYGQIVSKWKTHFENTSKYFIPRYEYNETYLPDFAIGVAYMIPLNIVYELYKSALNNTFLRLEDVFLTGVSIKRTNITLLNVQNFVTKKVNYTVCDVKKTIAYHLKQNEISDHSKLWRICLDHSKKTCY